MSRHAIHPRRRPEPGEMLGELRADLVRAAVEGRWGASLIAIGWLHLAFFAVNQAVATGLGWRWPHPMLWIAEVASVFAVLRATSGRWWSVTPLAGVLTRIWATYLIIAFNAATLNSMTGFELRWFLPVWASLGTFGFAATAWVCDRRFLIPAVALYFVGLALVRWPDWGYAMHGLAWWAILRGIARSLRRAADQRAASAAESIGSGNGMPSPSARERSAASA